jgi:hypothetical protein
MTVALEKKINTTSQPSIKRMDIALPVTMGLSANSSPQALNNKE